MDGTNRSVIVQDKITWPNGLTLDFVNDRIYWADAREDYIAFASLDGTNRHIGTTTYNSNDVTKKFLLKINIKIKLLIIHKYLCFIFYQLNEFL